MKATGLNPEDGSEPDMTPGLCMYESEGPGKDAYEDDKSPREKDGFRDGAADADSVDSCEAPAEERINSPPPAPKADFAPPARDRGVIPPTVSAAVASHHARVAWSWVTTFIEVKHNKYDSPYDVSNDGRFILPDTDRSKNIRAQIAKYASELFLRQHRQFVLTAIIVQRRAFLMRWDRVGALVAPPFDYVDEPEKLLRFLYRIAVGDRSTQGYDPTSSLASSDEIKRFQAYRDSRIKETSVLREYVDRVLSLRSQLYYPIYKVRPHICPCHPYSSNTAGHLPKHRLSL